MATITPKKIAIGAGVVAILWLIFKTKMMNKLGKLTDKNTPRGTDASGSGAFGASRVNKNGTRRTHEGFDIKTSVGEKIYSPIDGTFVRKAYPYDNTVLKGAVLKNDQYEVRLYYFAPNLADGTPIKKGQVIGFAQYMAQGKNMTNHLHIEVRAAGKLINPETLF